MAPAPAAAEKITGTVGAAGGGPINKAHVDLLYCGGSVSCEEPKLRREQVTNASGVYEFEEPAPPIGATTWYVGFAATGYAAQYYNGA